MVKRGLINTLSSIFFFILITASVYGISEKVILDARVSYIFSGKNVTLVGIFEETANFYIDGVFGSVAKGTAHKVNGVEINVTGVSRTPPKVIAILTVNYVCGDNICSSFETQLICCKDCGCLLNSQICLNNICVQNISQPQATYDCYNPQDCDDGDSCTIESCNTAVTPYKCEYSSIITCINDDRCCPLNCEDTQDNDCLGIDRCKRHDDCDDTNPCTSETCDGLPKRCNFVKNSGCPLSNICVTTGTLDKNRYCSDNGEWLNKKIDNEKCTEAYECFSGVCTLKRCGKNSFFLKLFKISLYIGSLIAVILLIGYVIISMKRKYN